MSRKILTTITALWQKEPSDSDLQVCDVYTYELPYDPPQKATGRLSCEAPVEQLLEMAYSDNEPVDKIICLVSSQAKDIHGKVQEVGGEYYDNITSYKYFQEVINRYINDKHPGARVPDFETVEYNVNETAACIHDILKYFSAEDVVDIDMTSGLRSQVIHVILCMEAMIYQEIKIKNLLYAQVLDRNKKTGRITHEEHIYNIINLINAVSDFTNHGKADALYNCFKDSEPLRGLCQKIKTFSDKLVICRTDGLSEDIEKINEYLDRVKDELGEAIRNNPSKYSNTEKVFQTLIPAIKEQFVEDAGDKKIIDKYKFNKSVKASTLTDIFLVMWCVKNGLIQQALSIIRENLYKIVIDNQWITYGDTMGDIANRLKSKYQEASSFAFERLYRIKPDFCLEKEYEPLSKLIGENLKDALKKFNDSNWSEITYDTLHIDIGRAMNNDFMINMSESNFHDIVCYAYYLQYIRNTVMHAGVYEGRIKVSATFGLEDKIGIEKNKEGKKETNYYLKEITLKNEDHLPNVYAEEVVDIENIKKTLNGLIDILLKECCLSDKDRESIRRENEEIYKQYREKLRESERLEMLSDLNAKGVEVSACSSYDEIEKKYLMEKRRTELLAKCKMKKNPNASLDEIEKQIEKEEIRTKEILKKENERIKKWNYCKNKPDQNATLEEIMKCLNEEQIERTAYLKEKYPLGKECNITLSEAEFGKQIVQKIRDDIEMKISIKGKNEHFNNTAEVKVRITSHITNTVPNRIMAELLETC